jgi:hypothetical protein
MIAWTTAQREIHRTAITDSSVAEGRSGGETLVTDYLARHDIVSP